MEPAVTRYLDREGPAFAYQMYGKGSVDVVFAGDLNHHVDLAWSDPHIHQMMEKLGQSVRVTIFQPRGFGPSEPTGKPVTVEEQADDIIAVMDAIGIRKACLYGNMTTSWGAALAAARQPGRVSALVLGNPIARGPKSAPPEHMDGWTPEEIETCIEKAQEVVDRWGEGMAINLWDAELATPYNRRLGGLLERCSATPAMVESYINYYLSYDACEILRAVRVPTWVLRTHGNVFPEAAARHVAELLPNATFHELVPTPTGASLGEALTPMFNVLAQVAVGEPVPADIDRFRQCVRHNGFVRAHRESGSKSARGFTRAKWSDLGATTPECPCTSRHAWLRPPDLLRYSCRGPREIL